MADRVDKWGVLQLLFDRAISAQADPSLAASTIAQRLQMAAYPALIDIYCEELIGEGLVSKADHGVRDRYKITGAGIRMVDGWDAVESDPGFSSASWTGKDPEYSLSSGQQDEIVRQIRGLKKVIEETPLTNEEKAQAISYVSAALIMAEAPRPQWHIVKETLILIASISTALALALQIAGMIS